MKIEIVKFDNGMYGVRKTVWRHILNPLLSVYKFLYLRRDSKDEYNPSARDFCHWNPIDINNAQWYQDADLAVVIVEYERYMDMLKERKRLIQAAKAVKNDKGTVVV